MPPFHAGRHSLRFWHMEGYVQIHEKTGLALAVPSSETAELSTGALWSKKVCSSFHIFPYTSQPNVLKPNHALKNSHFHMMNGR